MYTQNTELLYQAPSTEPVRSGTAMTDDELNEFVQALLPMLPAHKREAFVSNMHNHLGVNSNYAHKDNAMQGLNIIAERWYSENTAESEKASIATKLEERAEQCTPGFHNGINEVLQSFYIADNLPGLLFLIRQDLVNQLATSLTDDTHGNNLIFAIAENEGYGVRAVNREDGYIGNAANEDIKQRLKAVFHKKLNLFTVLKGLEEQLLGQLVSLGYEGNKPNGYDDDTDAKMINYFTHLFHEDPTVQNYLSAKVGLEEVQKQGDKARTDALEKIEALLRDHDISIEKYKTHKTQALLNGKSVKEQPFLKDFFKEIDELEGQKKVNFISDLETIKQKYRQSTNITKANIAYIEGYDDLKAKFFSLNQDNQITGIHLLNIRQCFWQQVRDHEYFVFRPPKDASLTAEEKLMDALTNPKGSAEIDALMPGFEGLIETAYDFASAMKYLNPEQQAKLYIKFEDVLPTFITNGRKFRDVMSVLNQAQRDKLLEETYGHFNTSSSPRMLGFTLKYLTPEQANIILGNHKSKLPEILQSRSGFNDACKQINPELQALLIQHTKHWLPSVIQSRRDIIETFERLSPTVHAELIEVTKDVLVNTIGGNYKTFVAIASTLRPESLKQLVEVFLQSNPQGNPWEYAADTILQKLNPELHKPFIETLLDKDNRYTKSSRDFFLLFKHIDTALQKELLQKYESNIRELIKDQSSFSDAIKNISPELHEAFIEQYWSKANLLAEDILQSSAPSTETMLRLLSYLLKQSVCVMLGMTTFFESSNHLNLEIQHCLEGIDQNRLVEQFHEQTEHLSAKEANQVYEALKDRLPKSFDLDALLSKDTYFQEMKAAMNELKDDYDGAEESKQDRSAGPR